MTKYLAVIDPACNRAEVDCFNDIVNRTTLRVHYHLPALVGMDGMRVPGYAELLAGVIVLGSVASVYDQRPWQEPLNEIIKSWALRGVPTLGICYGHQALAAMFGGKIDYHSPEKAKFKEMRTVKVDAQHFPGTSTHAGELFYTHCEVVTKLPPDFVEAGRSSRFGNEVIKHKSLPTWGFQAHVEATPGFMKISGYDETVSMERRAYGGQFLSAFLRICEDHAKA